jgi:integrase
LLLLLSLLSLLLAEAKFAEQKVRSTATYRSALLWYQRRAGVEAFASERSFILAAKGAKSQSQKAHKGVITPQQCMELTKLVLESPDYFVSTCKHCPQNITAVDFNKQLVDDLLMQWLAKLRPGELEKLRVRDLIATYETLRTGQSVVVNSLLFADRKNSEGGPLIISDEAKDHFLKMSIHKEKDSFLVPKCADTHIGQCLAVASVLLQWHPDVIWVAHSIRHSAFTDLEKGVTEAVDAFTSSVVSATLRGTYTTPLARRVGK